jgi:dihydroxyacetone kinase-like predicted kinase
MNGFINDAVGLFLYRSTLDTKFGDADLKTGDWFITRDKEVLGTGDSATEAVRSALEKLEHSGISDVAVYHGDGFDPRDLDSVISSISSVLPDVDIEEHFGGQNQAALIISLE